MKTIVRNLALAAAFAFAAQSADAQQVVPLGTDIPDYMRCEAEVMRIFMGNGNLATRAWEMPALGSGMERALVVKDGARVLTLHWEEYANDDTSEWTLEYEVFEDAGNTSPFLQSELLVLNRHGPSIYTEYEGAAIRRTGRVINDTEPHTARLALMMINRTCALIS